MGAPSFDLVTVGGGLGASAFAIGMAAQGARVLMLERERQFRDRVRGEYVCTWGVADARELGLLGVLKKAGAREVPWVDLGAGPRNLLETTPQKLPSVSFFHPDMQEGLLAAAEDAGAVVRRGVTVHGVETGSRPCVIAGENGNRERITARLIVAADGRNSAVRKWAGFALQRNEQPFVMAGVRLEQVAAREDLGQFLFNPMLGTVNALIPQGGGVFRAYLGHPKSWARRFQGPDNVPHFLAECGKALAPFVEYYARARAIGPLACFEGGDSWVEHPYRDGVALIGDAAATSDPSFGQGMSLTLRDARVLRDALAAGGDWEQAGHRYAQEHDVYFHRCHQVTVWMRNIFQEQGSEADARRQRALPRLMEDVLRIPDHGFSGPEMPLDETVRRRFFGED